MAVKNLNQNINAPFAADPCTSSSSKSSTIPSKFPNLFSKMVPLIRKNNSGTEELSLSSPSPTVPTQHSRYCELQHIFCYFDENRDGKITPSELRNCLSAMGEEMSSEEAEEAVQLSDSDGDGELGLEDFVKLVDGEDDKENDKSLMDAFRMYEMDGRGRITPKSLRWMLRRLGEDRMIEDCAVMIGRFDLNGDGVLNFEEFKIMMQ